MGLGKWYFLMYISFKIRNFYFNAPNVRIYADSCSSIYMNNWQHFLK